jgi:CBS domain containing-hemolysin-like protein
MRVIDLLLEMRDAKMQLAVVVDEFGGTDGLVTVEDLVEELVGELQEESASSQTESSRVVRLGSGEVEIDARIALDDLERDLGVRFSDREREDADTLSGLIVSMADRVPKPGEVVEHPSGLRFEVIDGDARRIKRVRIIGLSEVGQLDDRDTAPSS